jgi:DNA-directed RNA polymerase specialized sigma24 family protein
MATRPIDGILAFQDTSFVPSCGERTSDQDLLERFTTHRDAAAFAVLVRRYGPMVLDVCRGILAQEHDAEDAFQATFLVLLNQAPSLREPFLLQPWLHSVASRIARGLKRAPTPIAV